MYPAQMPKRPSNMSTSQLLRCFPTELGGVGRPYRPVRRADRAGHAARRHSYARSISPRTSCVCSSIPATWSRRVRQLPCGTPERTSKIEG
jgi:hypothetical protein